MFEIDSKLRNVIIIFIIINTIVYYYKPSFCFDENGNFKDFGVGDNKTIIPFWLFTLSISLLVYLYLSVREDDFV
tara:strand:- start:565 stop:789 length:225 start_codon:yes stop_codon:yes gene_type:complete